MFFIALALPAGALAGGGGKCNASACKVYTEGPGSAGGGGQQNHPSGQSTGPVKPVHISAKSSHVLSHAGKDKRVLHRILSLPDYGAPARRLYKANLTSVVAPSALGAAVDLGAGPTVLLSILLATAVALAAHGGFRSWRRRRPSA